MNIGGIIITALIIGLVIAFIGTSALKSELHSVASKTQANSYVVAGSLNIQERNETFLYSKTEKTENPENQRSPER